MKARAVRILLGLLIALAWAAPTAGSATHFGAECYGDVTQGASVRCSATFPLDGKRYLSTLETHANYHDVDGRGYFLLKWIDSSGVTVVSLLCRGMGLPGDGITDETRAAACAYYDTPKDSYVVGTQTIEVTAFNTKCPDATCRFHGRLRLSGEGDLY